MAELLDSENPEALALFILAGPDCARIVEEFEAVYDPPPSSTAHHEEGHSLQVKFRKDELSFVDVVVHMGNPFIATRQSLLHSIHRMSWNRSLLLLYLKSMQCAKPFMQHMSRKGWKRLQYQYPILSCSPSPTTCSPSPTDLTPREKARRTIAHRSRT